MEETWKTTEFASLVSSRHGADHMENSGVAHESVGWKALMADYHAGETAKLELEHSPNSVAAAHNIFLSAANRPEAGPYRIARFAAEAHLIACAQSLHSLGDIMANVVFTASGLPTDRLNKRDRSLHRIVKVLDEEAGMEQIVQPLHKLHQSPDFHYVRAFVNITKHRSLVDIYSHVSFKPEPRQGLMIEAFDYDGEPFEKRWASELYLESRVEIVRAVVATGIAVNRWLASDAA